MTAMNDLEIYGVRCLHWLMPKKAYQNTTVLLLVILISLMLSGCFRPDPDPAPQNESQAVSPTAILAVDSEATQTPIIPTPTLVQPTDIPPPAYIGTPTPDPTRPLKEGDPTDYDVHIIAEGETLSMVAQLYETSADDLLTINELSEDDFLAVGQQLLVPAGSLVKGPSFKIIPDSELVYGPALIEFDTLTAASSFRGYLLYYDEVVEGLDLSGPEILQLVASRQSVNPRLLLAVLEYQAGWLTNSFRTESEYPLGFVKDGYQGLYQQLSWAANKLNQGYYGRAEGGLTFFELADGTRVDFARDINDGTAGVQFFFASYPTSTYNSWLTDVHPDGFYSVYNELFGNPFVYGIEPLWPSELVQPGLNLPWSQGETWYFSGGPHGGWASGSAWAAIDFAPPGDHFGCYISDDWVTSMSDGLVVQSDFGTVVVDLDSDGFAGTGWAITYLHLGTRDRVPKGTIVQTGDILGHPSCEGGYSNGTHVHISRTYNGRWVSADGDIPFLIGGWLSTGLGREYDGYLVKGEVIKEACECREERNAVPYQ